MAFYTLTFVNGVAQDASLPIGSYTVTETNIDGYEGAAIEGFTVEESTTTVELTIAAAGGLTVNVQDGSGNPVNGGTLQLSDENGATTYGDAVNIVNGVATFANVPYDTANGVQLYVSQPTAAEGYEPIAAPVGKLMTSGAETLELVNERTAQTVTVELEDANYPDVTPINGTVTVRN